MARTQAHHSGVIDSDNVEDNGEECDKDNNIDCESEISDLPSLADIFLRSDSGFNCKGDRENSAFAATAAGIQLGASLDRLIVLDDDWPADDPYTPSSDDKNLPSKTRT
ncbi:hypothetical protein GJ744_010442 [Endocarpon pusillum]|uniref:Uncharacterized protein n=1 Tax=Endocarpon pusillum TaxID=364733 RepID=A0A8H7AI30_9EURO|nr:hypothetical protein GJ744_010442 [Endocarpon pusillum]